MELQSLTLSGLVAIGVVNVITFWKPNIDSKIKFAISFLAAFLISFVPPIVGNIILEKAQEALTIAFMASGIYKLAQKVSGE